MVSKLWKAVNDSLKSKMVQINLGQGGQPNLG